MGRNVSGYQKFVGRAGEVLYYHNLTNEMFEGELATLRDFYRRACLFASTKPLGEDVHQLMAGGSLPSHGIKP